MKKNLLRIHLHIDIIEGGHPMQEQHTTFEVIKETTHRCYLKQIDFIGQRANIKYVDKEYLNTIRGNVECVFVNNINEYKSICNLSVYCHPEDKLFYQRLIRSYFIERANKMKKQVNKLCDSFAHDEILEPDNPYIKVESDSQVVI